MNYVALIHRDEGSDYGVSFPDFPGCISAGRTLDEARLNAEEALALHIEGMLADDEAIPEPSSLDAIMSEAENRDGVAILVKAAVPAAKAVRINITLPGDVLAAVDRYVQERGLTRSGFLAKAARDVIAA
jgi:predicted RNase H-like HicB family nuclease